MDAFLTHDPRFKAILGHNPSLTLLLENKDYPFAHEAGVYIPDDNTLFITSNHLLGATKKDRSVQISKITLTKAHNGVVFASHEELPSTAIPMGNGGVNYKDGMLFCAQGSHELPSGLYFMHARPPHDTTIQPLLTNFYGREFNSVNDVVVARDGAMWFTDPVYGSEHGHRPSPSLPGQVYRFEPGTGAVRTVADGFVKPNGICFSPDERTVYVTDTARLKSIGMPDEGAVSSIYAFDVTYYHNEPFLTNRRLFAMAPVGIPDGIKCDLEGNVYSGCGDGVTVWSPGGVLLGRILVEGGAANFCFGREGEIFILNEHRLWRAQLGVKGALLGV